MNNFKILLINPLMTNDCETPLGLLYIATKIKREGFNVKILDLSFSRKMHYFRKILSREKPNVIGFTVMSTTYPIVKKLSAYIKDRYKNIVIIAGGPHPTLFIQGVLENKNIDIVVVGEGEESFNKVLRSIIDNKMSFDNIKGIGFKHEGKIIINNHVMRPDLNNSVFPDRSFLFYEDYARRMAGYQMFGHRTLNIIASRGCAFNCSFCQPVIKKIFGNKVRLRESNNIVDEIEDMVDRYDISGIWFSDDNFTYNKEWIHNICDETMKRKLRVFWSCNSRVDTVDENLIRHMSEANCIQLRYGLESGSQLVLNKSKKGINIEQTENAFYLARKYRINTWAYTMLGGPYETNETFQETKRLLRKLKPVHIQLTYTTPLPGTNLEKEIVACSNIKRISHKLEDINLHSKYILNNSELKRWKVFLMKKQFRLEFPFYNKKRAIFKT
ncbi:B12-binding domain-containing radical SAM protein [bacterium]|nr:B12-binding domain-containing radical SAM protein [bacterium]MBU4510703.1 B12-binding domain-containing radical SAM protein [bacterium]